MKKLAGYGAGLIALYLVVAHGTQAGKAFRSGAAGGVSLIKAFQGR